MHIPISWQRFGIRTKLRAFAVGARMQSTVVWASIKQYDWITFAKNTGHIAVYTMAIVGVFLSVVMVQDARKTKHIIRIDRTLKQDLNSAEENCRNDVYCLTRIKAEVCEPIPVPAAKPVAPVKKPVEKIQKKRKVKPNQNRYREW